MVVQGDDEWLSGARCYLPGCSTSVVRNLATKQTHRPANSRRLARVSQASQLVCYAYLHTAARLDASYSSER
eukprot:2018847-Rhodomonas_salina.2